MAEVKAPKAKETGERRISLEPANAVVRPAEYYKRRYSEEDLLKKSPVAYPDEADVLVERGGKKNP